MSAPTPREQSRPSRRIRATRRRSQAHRLVPQADALETRRLLAYTAVQSGGNLFIGDASNDTIIFEAVNGLLRHNRFTAGDPGFNSDFDFDSLSPGDQTVASGQGTLVTVNMGAGNDNAILGTAANPAILLGSQFSIDGGTGSPTDVDTLSVNDGAATRTANASYTYTASGTGITASDGTNSLSSSYSNLDSVALSLRQGPATQVSEVNSVSLLGNQAGTPIAITGGGANIIDTYFFTEGATFSGSLASAHATFDYRTFSTPAVVDLGAGTATGISGTFTNVETVLGGAGNDSFTAGTAAVAFIGSGGNDTLIGGPGNDGLDGDDGNDIIDGRGGDDSIAPGSGLDTVTGGDGFDTIFIDSVGGSGGSNVTIAGTTTLITTGTSGSDGTISFTGSDVELIQVNLISSGIPSDDTLTVTTGVLIPFIAVGNDGNDTLDFSGFAGAAELDGDDGNDTLIGSTGPTTFFPGTGTNTVIISGSAGTDDIRLSASNGGTIRRNGVDSLITLAQTQTLTFNGGAGSDSLTIDVSAGIPFPSSGLTYDGGAGGSDSLNIVGLVGTGPLNTVTYTPSNVFGSGVYSLDGSAITFSNLEPINDTAPANSFIFNGPSGPQPIQIINGPAVTGLATIQFSSASAIPTFELVNFANKASVTYNGGLGGNGPQSLLVNIPQAAAGLNLLTVNAFDGGAQINATPATGRYVFGFNSGDDTVTVRAAGLGASNLTLDGGPGIDTLNFDTNGQAATGTDTTLTFNGRTLTYLNFEVVNALNLNVFNTSDSGFGSFRQAILSANSITGANTITFAIPGTGPFTIFPDTPLPDITDAVTINGYSQPGSSPNTLAIGTNAVIAIQLRGPGQPSSGQFGLTITGLNASGSVIRGLAIGGYDNGIRVLDTSNVRLLGNFIGVDTTGVAALANLFDGILVGDSTNVFIGTPALADRNLISGNLGSGIGVDNSLATSIANNLIGTGRTGAAAIANALAGITVDVGSIASIIGGPASGAGNVISGNAGDGISVLSANALIEGNRIGLTAAGTAALPNVNGIRISNGGRNASILNNVISGNSGDGVFIAGTGSGNNTISNNRIGTDAAGNAEFSNARYGVELAQGTANNRVANNVISGNVIAGIRITDAQTSGNLVTANRIGTNAAGTASIPNGLGISVEGATRNTIGSIASSAGNVISGNDFHGISFTSNADRNLVVGNVIGLNATGTAALPNGFSGIDLELGTEPGQTIGGLSASQRNVISGNTESGIVISGGTGFVDGTVIQGNYIGTNAAGTAAIGNGLDGIQILSAAGMTIGGATNGAGNLISGNARHGIAGQGTGQIAAVLIQGNRIGTNAAGTAAIGNVESGVAFGTGTAISIGGATVAARNLISGNTASGLDLTGVSGSLVQGNFIGTDAAGTAAIGNGINVLFPAGGNTLGGLGAGQGNLISGSRGNGVQITGSSAALRARTNLGSQILGNAIGTNATGTAALANAGSGISVTGNPPLLIQGNLISGNAANGIEINSAVNGVPLTASIRLLGNLIGTNKAGTVAIANGGAGVSIAGNGITVGGMGSSGRNVISGNAGAGIEINGNRNAVYNNAIGTNAAGTAALGNGTFGVRLVAASSSGTTANSIGGVGLGNIISGNGSTGVALVGRTTSSNLVSGNQIGTNAAGTAALPNRSGNGVLINGAPGNIIGGSADGAGNLISGQVNSSGIGVGIRIQGDSPNQSLRTLVQGNRIGTNRAGTAALPNAVAGIYIVSSGDNTVGGTSAGARNVLSGNGSVAFPGAGLWIEDSASNNVAVGNYIGISADGSTPLGNRGVGVVISDAARNVVGPGNVISANGLSGVQVFGTASTGNAIKGNFIGTDALGGGTVGGKGIFPFGNGSRNAADDGEVGVGVYLDSTTGNTVGGTSAADANVISGNRTYGVQIFGGSANTVVGNRIGTDAAGAVAVANRFDGVLINGSSNNAIVRNLISGNRDTGVQITGAASTGNALTDNQIGVTATGTPLVNGTFGVAVTDGATGNTLTGGVIVANGGASNAVFDPNGGITVTNVSASVLRVKAGKVTMARVKIKNKAHKAAKPVKAIKPFANRPLQRLQKGHSAKTIS